MDEHNDTNDDGRLGRMPDHPLNRNWSVGTHASNGAADEAVETARYGPSRRGFLAASTAVGLGVAGLASPVGADDHDEHAAETEEPEIEEGARIVHLSPDAPVVDVYVDGELWFEDVEPFATQTEYLEYVPGTYMIQFAPAGEGRDAAVLEEEVTFEEGRYTVAAVGEVCAVSDEPLRIVNLKDDTSPTAAGHARVRGINASPDAPPIDFTVGGKPVVENLGFGEGSYGEISAEEEIIEIRECTSDEIVERFEIDLEAGHVYTIFAVGDVDSESTPENASLRIGITEDAAPGER